VDHRTVINWIDGLTFAWWMIPAGIAAILVGAWWVYAALRPRRRTALAVTAASSVWIGPADLARLVSRAAEKVPEVLEARSSATLRKLTVTAHTTAEGGATQMKSAVADAVRDSVAAIVNPPPKIQSAPARKHLNDPLSRCPRPACHQSSSGLR
jgi:hypothetical protein